MSPAAAHHRCSLLCLRGTNAQESAWAYLPAPTLISSIIQIEHVADQRSDRNQESVDTKALDSCHLGDEVRKTELKLDSKVTESGKNWSAGQRQLVCFGRVILKRRKILVLDEATSSVDPITENLIQKTLKHKFAECTMNTIAHRITSVLDSDNVLLLDKGEIAEHDAPAKLLEGSSSPFSKLVAEYTMMRSPNEKVQVATFYCLAEKYGAQCTRGGFCVPGLM
ncbi:hypothetical protein C2845_PM04G03340 [Panicum miliaceum]|uniref:ABC transporter domain-containing protein n=1 Tax=Panicum miliaceum TaxID=4540 RepID=A0A3L6QQ99_PANMI|nr:hypothetical protein C2845_PM04G03340 [Panicum miliaceum]